MHQPVTKTLLPALLLAVLPLAWADETGVNAAAISKARVNYMINCQGCHAHNGAASRDGDVPRMKDYVGNFLRVPNGRAYLVQIPGTASAPIPDKELAQLLNWMLVNIGGKSTPANFEPFDESEVGRLRRSPLTEVDTIRRKLINAIEQSG